MDIMKLIAAFAVGGAICVIAQLLIDLTRLTPARILVSLVFVGVISYAVGIYEPLFNTAGCGASLPLLGYGASVAKGVKEAIDSSGLIGILKGPFSAGSVGCTSALLFALALSLVFRPHAK